MIQGKRIEIGNTLYYGPLNYLHVCPNQTVSVEVVHIREISGNERLIPPMDYYFPNRYKDRDSIGKLELYLPPESRNNLQLWLIVQCDCHGFKIQMYTKVDGEPRSAFGYYPYKATKYMKRQVVQETTNHQKQ